jgi:hypothetical protein
MDPLVQLAVLQPDEVDVMLLKWSYVLHVLSVQTVSP